MYPLKFEPILKQTLWDHAGERERPLRPLL